MKLRDWLTIALCTGAVVFATWLYGRWADVDCPDGGDDCELTHPIEWHMEQDDPRPVTIRVDSVCPGPYEGCE